VLADGDWWRAMVIERKRRGDGGDGGAAGPWLQRVRYEGGSEEQDEWIPEGSGRLREPEPEEVQAWSEVDQAWVAATLSHVGKGWGWVHLGPREQDGEWMPLASQRLRRDGAPPRPGFVYGAREAGGAREPAPSVGARPRALSGKGGGGKGKTPVSGVVESLDSTNEKGLDKKGGKKRAREDGGAAAGAAAAEVVEDAAAREAAEREARRARKRARNAEREKIRQQLGLVD